MEGTMRGFLKRAAGLALALAAAGSAQAGPDLAAMTQGELTAFTKAMPKGGELHNHIAGAIFPETFLAWAVEDKLCVDVEALAFRPPCEPAGSLKSAAAALADDALRSALYDSLTTRHPGFRDRSGHDQFFSAFARFGAAGQRRGGDMLAQVMEDLARQNTFYLEAMVTPQGAPSMLLGAKVGWKGEFAAQKAANLEAGLEELVAAAVSETDALEARAREVLKCGTAQAMAGCQVTVRYLVQTNRVAPLAATFAQLQLGVALIQRDRRWVGLQMVAPEDHPSALANYSEHMRIVAFLTDRQVMTSN
jgi:adenosine deaminase